ncbi:MAG: hypothetical protein HS128_01215 [Ideonella sp.]|nr:hypothetical protein [Ideonella sp.]MCC7459102.1 hypothetical protein [Nitrospira sp.]
MFERIAIRTTAIVLSGLVTLGILGALADTADAQHAQANAAYAASHNPVQQVVVVGQRQPRS